MYKERPLRWIGEAEARRMMVHALSEASAEPPPHCDNDNEEPATWLQRARRWVFGRSVEVGG
jgi:hypothetical protein